MSACEPLKGLHPVTQARRKHTKETPGCGPRALVPKRIGKFFTGRTNVDCLSAPRNALPLSNNGGIEAGGRVAKRGPQGLVPTFTPSEKRHTIALFCYRRIASPYFLPVAALK